MKYFLIAGEASGDMHAAQLMKALLKQDPEATFLCLGGDKMQAAGGTLVRHIRDMAYMGIWAVLRNIFKVLANLRSAKQAILKYQPDMVILIDYPDFNLNIARFVRRSTGIPVTYYISPKIWAWKTYRVHRIRRDVDLMLTIFPFETDFYRQYHFPVHYVGNPSIDTLLPQLEKLKKELKDSASPYIALLPGSRKQEIRSCLPTMLQAVSVFTNFQIRIAGAPGIDVSFYEEVIPGCQNYVTYGDTHRMLAGAAGAVVNSGTATLEAAIIGVPQVVVYHLTFGKLAYMLKNYILKVPYISLVNILSKDELVKELIAHLFTVDNLITELDALLHQPDYRNKMISGYNQLRDKLGKPGAASRAAGLIFQYLQNDK